MLQKTTTLFWRTLPTDIEALVLEARLIKKHKPPYNVLFRDDKNYFYVGFTKERFPRIFLTHQPKVGDKQYAISNTYKNLQHTTYNLQPIAEYIGPFTDGHSIKRTLRLFRRIFPYATHKGFPKRCLEHDLGLCPIPPQAEADSEWQIANSKIYRRNIQAIRDMLTGKRTTLMKQLEKEMRAAVKQNDFETAADRRDELRGLERIFAHRSVLLGSAKRENLPDIPPIIRRAYPKILLHRIEGYDIANLQRGKAATGAMVVFMSGRPETSLYRQFRIKNVRGANDVAMLKEVLTRRLRHSEWPLPDIFLIDGGSGQLNAALAALQAYGKWRIANSRAPKTTKLYTIGHKPIAIMSLAKRNEELYLPGRAKPFRLPKNDPFLLMLMHIRDEAHRFARRYHHRLRALDS